MNKDLSLNPNKIVAYLQKPCKEFTKADIVRYIKETGIRMVNFMYPAGDGRLKTGGLSLMPSSGERQTRCTEQPYGTAHG